MMPPGTFLKGLVGVFGYPVAENPTQAMMEPAFEALGLDWRYLTVEVRPERLREAVRGALAMGWKGFNCTIPHKVAVLDHLDELSPAAELIGAVNCVVIHEGRLIGHNTDGKGFLESVQRIRPAAGLNAVILGAGGAARAIASELAMAGASHLTIVNRTPNRGRALADAIVDRTGVPAVSVDWNAPYVIPPDARLLVNATSIGLFPDGDSLPNLELGSVHPGLIVCDVIPNPPETRLLREARDRGCTTLDGLGMLVNQGILGIRHWSGLDADPRIMRHALENIFSGP